MILVLLGTNDKPFNRLLEQIDELVSNKIINEKVVVQSGYTKYQSDNMEIFDLVTREEMDKFIKEANYIITHGGVGSIMDGVKAGKVVIAVPRLSKYGEHVNDHQLQIIKSFGDLGYIIPCYEVSELENAINKVRKTKPKPIVSNTKNMVKLIEDFIDNN